MARGRFIDKRTAKDERLAEVSLKANFLYLVLTPFCDVDGKLSGNAVLVKADTCPLRTEMTERVITKCLLELHDAGLIDWYSAEGRKVVKIRDFNRYQQGLRRDRENPSEFPDPEGGEMPADCPQVADTLPAQVQGKGQVQEEVKEKEKEEVQEEAEVEEDDFDKLFGGLSPGGEAPTIETDESETVASSPDLSWVDQMREKFNNIK